MEQEGDYNSNHLERATLTLHDLLHNVFASAFIDYEFSKNNNNNNNSNNNNNRKNDNRNNKNI